MVSWWGGSFSCGLGIAVSPGRLSFPVSKILQVTSRAALWDVGFHTTIPRIQLLVQWLISAMSLFRSHAGPLEAVEQICQPPPFSDILLFQIRTGFCVPPLHLNKFASLETCRPASRKPVVLCQGMPVVSPVFLPDQNLPSVAPGPNPQASLFGGRDFGSLGPSDVRDLSGVRKVFCSGQFCWLGMFSGPSPDSLAHLLGLSLIWSPGSFQTSLKRRASWAHLVEVPVFLLDLLPPLTLSFATFLNIGDACTYFLSTRLVPWPEFVKRSWALRSAPVPGTSSELVQEGGCSRLCPPSWLARRQCRFLPGRFFIFCRGLVFSVVRRRLVTRFTNPWISRVILVERRRAQAAVFAPCVDPFKS